MNLEKAKPDPPLHFPDWPAALAATGGPAEQQAAVGATVRCSHRTPALCPMCWWSGFVTPTACPGHRPPKAQATRYSV